MKDLNKSIYVTQPSLPPLEEFVESLKIIWDNKILTNGGPFHQKLENELASYLGVKYISLFANGTLALITALQALRITGEVITTPFSFVATTHAIWWNGIKPVFVDIEPETFTMDPEKVEAAITPKTTAILPVHVYGYPCKVDQLKDIAQRHNLKLIYDAAHTFGAKYSGQSLCSFGDLSILSFHATKVFNTFEGGAIICHDSAMKRHIDNLKNFGFEGETSVVEIGINGKMNEFQAALGLLQLKHLAYAFGKRKEIHDLYNHKLCDLPGIYLPPKIKDFINNYAYFPILVDKEIYGKTRDELYEKLKHNGINCRKYFYPLISSFPMYQSLPSASLKNLKTAEKTSNQILCLPIYPNLKTKDVIKIANMI